jgi:hypothetical protein
MQRKTFSPGELIFREGDESHAAYWIIKGKVEISIDSPTGRSILTTLDDGEIFGEMGMIDDQPRAATARALVETAVDVIDEAAFRDEVLRKEARLMPYLDTLFERLRTTNALLQAQLGKGRVETPLASTPKAEPEVEATPYAWPDAVTLTSTEASRVFHPDGLRAEITRFPYRIGRRPEHEDGMAFGRTDLLLRDERPYSVSRGHCLIECKGRVYFVRDCGSRLGTIVNGVEIGSNGAEFIAPLLPGENTLAIGPADSTHQYVVTIG